MNTEVYSRTEKTSDIWHTPKSFFNLLDNIFHFTLDPCTDKENWLGAEKFYTEEDNGLKQNWKGERVFVNPPFSDIDKWVKKCYKEGQKKDTFVVMILPSRTDTGYWHKYIMKANEIKFCKGRVNFLIQCDYCGKQVSKTIYLKSKNKRFCQKCYAEKTGDIKKVGNGSTFPLVIVLFKERASGYPIIKPFYHKKKDLLKYGFNLDKFIESEV